MPSERHRAQEAAIALSRDAQMDIPRIYSATPASPTGQSAGAITGTVGYVCPGGRDAASPVSTLCKDPISAPARTAAGGIGCLTALAKSVSLTKRPDCKVASIPAPPALDGDEEGSCQLALDMLSGGTDGSKAP